MIGEGGLRLERSLVEGLARRAGVPIVPIALKGTERQLLADAMMQRVAELLPPAYQGVYARS